MVQHMLYLSPGEFIRCSFFARSFPFPVGSCAQRECPAEDLNVPSFEKANLHLLCKWPTNVQNRDGLQPMCNQCAMVPNGSNHRLIHPEISLIHMPAETSSRAASELSGRKWFPAPPGCHWALGPQMVPGATRLSLQPLREPANYASFMTK